MRIRIHEAAARELDEAIKWYELQSQGLGERFKTSVAAQIRKIRKNLNWFPIESTEIYKAYIPKFPYKILFTIEKDSIVIWAIAHMHRKPWFWHLRTGN